MRILKWAGALGLLLVVCLVAAATVLHSWVNGADFRARVEQEASAALGVRMQLGSLAVDVWPAPAVAATQVHIATQPPLTLARVEARPRWGALLRGEVRIATLVVREAVLPQQALAALGAVAQRRQKAAGAAPRPAASASTDTGTDGDDDALSLLPRRAVFDHVSWVDARGSRTTVDAQLHLDDAGALETFTFKILQGRFAGAQGNIERAADHWPVRVEIGGGRVAGRLHMEPARGGARRLSGQLETQGVEVSALTAPSRTLTGKLQATSTLRAEFREPAQLADALHTQTQFTVRDAVVHGIDLAQAVQTVGLSRGGLTRLDTLAGQVVTRGQAAELNNLVASSGALAATGRIAMAANKALNGRINVDVNAGRGAIGVPLAVGGTLDNPSVTLTRGALIGAAIGTALAPGVGTGAGAKLGDRLGDSLKGLFGK